MIINCLIICFACAVKRGLKGPQRTRTSTGLCLQLKHRYAAGYLSFLACVYTVLCYCAFCRWMCLMQLNVTAKKDDSLSSWPARIMGRDRHVTGRQRGLGCRCVKDWSLSQFMMAAVTLSFPAEIKQEIKKLNY